MCTLQNLSVIIGTKLNTCRTLALSAWHCLHEYNFTAPPVCVCVCMYLKVLEIPVNIVSPSRSKKPIPL